ncbi:MAG: hypothetical protein ABIJ56_16690 [Pseudomonadota bacterium]
MKRSKDKTADPPPPAPAQGAVAEPGAGGPQPSLSDWRQLYRAAADLWKAAPWDWMSDTDLFAVKNPADGQIAYCCVIGEMRETLGLIAFLGTDGLECWRWMQGREKTLSGEELARELIFRQRGLSLTFSRTDELEKEDIAVIRKLKLRARGPGSWPHFRSHTPGLFPWFLTKPEAAFMTLVLRQALDVSARFGKNPGLLDPPAGANGLFFARVPRTGAGAAGSAGETAWEDGWVEPLPEADGGLMPSEEIDEARLAALAAAAARTDDVLEIDADRSSQPVVGKEDGRLFFPLFLLVVDSRTGFIYGAHFEKRETAGRVFVDKLLGALERKNIVPAAVRVKREEIGAWLQPVTSRLGIELSLAPGLPALEEALASMEDYLNRRR